MKNDKLRVLVVLPTLRVGNGIASHVMNYYNEIFDKIDVDFISFTKLDNKYTRTITERGGRIFYFGKNFLRCYRKIKRFFELYADRYDIVHCHVINYGLPYLYLAKKYGIKNRIVHVHSSRYSANVIKSAVCAPIARLCMRMSTCLVACSRQAGERAYRKRPFKVINNAINLSMYVSGEREEIRTKLGVDEATVLFGNVGRLAKEKNQAFVLAVFQELKRISKFKSSKLVLIGKGPDYARLVKKTVDMGLSEDVCFVENTDDICDYYAAMDCLIHPSLFEGLGMALIEAQASGLVCVCSDNLPSEVFASELVHGVSLADSANEWATMIAEMSFARTDVVSSLRKTGFDISAASTILLELYEKMMKGCLCASCM